MNEGRSSLVAGMPVTPNVHLLKPLGAGGMGAVWLANHTVLKRHVVVKFMLGGMETNVAAANRFRREAEAAAKVNSPHVVHMHDYGVTEGNVPFIVMEHLEGHDLGEELAQRGALEPAKAIGIVQQVAKALTKVHAAGLLHRDIKPDNIFLCKGDDDDDDERFVKLLDFGIAKSAEIAERDITLDGETKTGQVVGTPFYMSPEQVTAQKSIDARSDLWALGVVTFEAMTGKRPFDGPSFGALAVKIATGVPPRPSSVNPALPASFDAWFAKACARDAERRFPSARAMAEALREAFSGVVSLPPSGVMSDSSGERKVPTPEPSDPSLSKRPPTPTELASTVNQDTPDPSLARSDAGSAVPAADAEPAKRNNGKMFAGVAVLFAVAAGVVALGMGRGPSQTGTPATTSTVSTTTSAKNAPPVVPTASASTTASASASAPASASASASASAPASASASASAVAAPPPKPIPVVAGKPPPPVVVKPAASTAKPEESAKPAPKPSTSGGDILY